MTEQRAERFLLATAADLLAAGRAIDRLSRALTVLAFAMLLAPSLLPMKLAGFWLVAVASVLGLVQMYFGARVAFDSALFRRLADGAADLDVLDGALAQLGLLPPGKAGRPLPERLAGARGLLLRQAGLLVLQAAVLGAGGVTGL